MSEDYAAAENILSDAERLMRDLISENKLLKESGIVEVAVRNQSVADYMKHWESRAEAAEALLAQRDAEIAKMREMLYLTAFTLDILASNVEELDEISPQELMAAHEQAKLAKAAAFSARAALNGGE